MQSELAFIALLVAPWVLILIAYLYYRQRRRREQSGDDTLDRDTGNAE